MKMGVKETIFDQIVGYTNPIFQQIFLFNVDIF